MNTYSDWPSENSNDISAADVQTGLVWSAEWFPPGADEPGEPTAQGLGATPALRGRPGGPGFAPDTAGSAAARSPWQRSQRLWSESGVQWAAPGTAGIPAAVPEPGPVPESLPAARRRSQVRYQGRHARPRRLPAQPAVPLGAPVVASRDADRDQVSAFPPETADPGAWKPGTRRTTGRRVVSVVLPAAVLTTVAAVAIGLLTSRGPRFGQAAVNRTPGSAAHRAGSKVTPTRAPQTIGMYSGQQGRGVFQQIDHIASYGDTIVTTGSQSSDGQVRQQFFVSADSGASWRLAPVRAAGGGQPPLGHAATWIAGGPAGWLAVGPRATWASRDGLSWTLTAAHGITTPRPGDQVQVLTGTASGFLAGGAHGTVWVSRDGVSWRQLTAAQLGLASEETVQSISSAASRGPDTVISGTVARGAVTYPGVWLSTDGGSSWTRVAVPADHGAGGGIVGLSSDAAGFLAVRPGRTGRAADGVTYFSTNGMRWQYAGTIGPAVGWSPAAVIGGSGGFAVTGQSAAGAIAAYTGPGAGAAWTPAGSLGASASESLPSAVVTANGTLVAAGSAGDSGTGQQGVLLEANRAGSVRSVPLADIPGAVVPELAMNGMAAAGEVQVAVGSVDGYPAIWRRQHLGSWTLVSSSALTAGQHRLAALTGVTRGPEGWLAVGVPGPIAFTSADGVTWQPAPGNIVRDMAGAPAVTVAAGAAGYVIAGNLAAPGGGRIADVWWSPDLTSWSQVRGMNDEQVLAVASDAHGFVSAGSRDGRPAVWTTADGRSWTAILLPMPAGASSAVLQQVAIKGSRVAVLGQASTGRGVVPFAALSVNGGTSWRPAPFASPGPDTAFTALIAGSRGFTAVGQYGPPGQASPAAWTSAGGTAWARSRLSGLTGSYRIAALAPEGAAATAIGSIATQQSQGAFMVGVPAP
ncbi:MAG: hypothetical protein JO345_36795 [Streptosporangiaceae bacterium]|nr:hypothetical protein [Streptosporangiaceae bacterium]